MNFMCLEGSKPFLGCFGLVEELGGELAIEAGVCLETAFNFSFHNPNLLSDILGMVIVIDSAFLAYQSVDFAKVPGDIIPSL